jgi:hypothetical protein
MEENEISLENTADETEKTAYAEEENSDVTENETAEKPAEEMPEEGGEGEEISAEAFAKTLANPMFALFARGRSGGIEEAVRDFEKMLMAGRSTLTEEEIMKMTPGACGSYLGNALSERQRKIARDAGMSYREYYEIIRTIPTKTK